MVQYQVSIDGTTFSELNNVNGDTTINPFGDRFVCEFIDNGGSKFDNISVDDAVEIFAREPTPSGQPDNSFSSIFEGYVVQSDEKQEGSRDVLQVTVYSFDQIIRNERISNDQSGNTIATALENIITTDTPVEYVAGNVSVGDNRTLNRPLQGLTVEEALRVLSLRSVNENYGVNTNREFFFRPRVEANGDKDVTDSFVTNYDIPERGKESKNEITVNYNNDNERITVSNGSNQLNVQDSLNTQGPVAFPDEISRPSITDRQEALAEGREFLRQRENTLAGRVTVVGDTGFLSNNVGDTINVTITPRGIDDEFVIVGKGVDYLRNEISYDIIQKRGDQDSLLKEIGQQLKREELSGTDQGTPSDKVTQTEVRVDIEQSYSGVTAQQKKVTTVCRNKLREAWLADVFPRVDTIKLGSGDSALRSNTTVPNVVDTIDVFGGTENGSDALDVAFDFSGTGNIIGLVDNDNDLLFIAKIEEETDPSGTLTITINDGDTDKSVLTDTGKEAVRDFLQGETSLRATKVEYGDSDTEPAESDASISTQVSQTYNDNLVLSADTTTEWDNNTSLETTDRVFVENGTLKLAQSAFVEDASGSATSGDYSGGDARNFNTPGDNEQFDITVGYESTFTVATRTEVTQQNDYNEYNVYIDGEQIGPSSPATTLGWEDLGSKTLTPGTYTIEVELNNINGFEPDESALDVIVVYDNSLSYNFDNDNGGNGGYLDGPELYPTVESVDIDTLTPPQQVSAAELQTTFNDTSNGQFVEIGNETTNTANNSENVSVNFATPSDSINATLGLDGFGSRTTATPQQRFNGQTVDVADIFTDLAVLNKSDVGRADYEVIFSGSDVNGLTLKEAGQVNSNGDALTRSIFPTLEPSGEAVIYSEDLGFDIS